MEIKASPDQIDAVAANLVLLGKQLSDANAQLSGKLRTLSQSFRDEQFTRIQSIVNGNEAKISEVTPDIATLSDKLIEFATLMRTSGNL
jgi:hypothetical protein